MDIRLVTGTDVNNPDENDLYVDPVTGDFQWYGADGSLDPAEVAQRVRIRLRFWKGEWFIDPDEGTPYIDEILDRSDLSRVSVIIRRIVAETPGVASVNSLALQLDNSSRTLNVTFVAVLDSGHVLNSDDFGPFIVEV